MNSLTPLSSPAAEPLSLAEIKAHLRIEHGDEDGLLDAALVAAREAVERYLRRALMEQRWQLVLDRWPVGPVRLPRPPLLSVDAIRVFDGAGAATELAAPDYKAETRAEPGFVLPAGLVSFPPPGRRHGGIEIDFTAGYGNDWNAVPAPIRQALLLIVADCYEGRAAAAHAIVGTARSLLDPYRMVSL